MRTNIDIDDALIAEAMTATGQSTKKATVEEALRSVVRWHRQKKPSTTLLGLVGKAISTKCAEIGKRDRCR